MEVALGVRWVAVVTAVMLAGCGGSIATNAGLPFDGGFSGADATLDDAPGSSSGVSSSSGGGSSSGSSSGGSMCAIACASDSDCQNSCPPVMGGVNCCDVASGTCFASANGACKQQQDAAPE